MSDWGVYSTIFGVLLLLYVAVRISIWDNFRVPKARADDQPGTALDTCPLSKRLDEVKRNHSVELPVNRNAFKKPLLVEQRREVLAQLAFFQKSATPEPPEKEDGLTLILV